MPHRSLMPAGIHIEARRPSRSRARSSENSIIPTSIIEHAEQDQYGSSGAVVQVEDEAGDDESSISVSAYTLSTKPSTSAIDSILTLRPTPPITIQAPRKFAEINTLHLPVCTARVERPGGFFPDYEITTVTPTTSQTSSLQSSSSPLRRNKSSVFFFDSPPRLNRSPRPVELNGQKINLPDSKIPRSSTLVRLKQSSITTSTMEHIAIMAPPTITLGKYHPSNYKSKTSSVNSSKTNSTSSIPKLRASPSSTNLSAPTSHIRQTSTDLRKKMQVYSRDMMEQAARCAGIKIPGHEKVCSPRLDPLASPGPVTPFELEGDGYLVAGLRVDDVKALPAESTNDVVGAIIKRELTRDAARSIEQKVS